MPDFLPIAYFKDRFIPFSEANVSIATHGLHYGTGAFGGLRAIPNPQNPRQILTFRLDRHSKRLSQSARFLHFDLPAAKIQQVLVDFVQKNAPTEPVYLRPFICTSEMGLVPRLHNIEKSLFVFGLPMGDYLSNDGVKCRISSWCRQEDRSFPLRGKITGAYITSSLAKTEAIESGFDEAILLNAQGKVCEATGMNIFLVRDGKLITPDVDQDVLEGITRDSIIVLAQEMGIPVVQRTVDKSELYACEEVFLCGTAAKITPIRQIENYTLPTERPVTTQLKQKLADITENRDQSHPDWIFAIDLP
ncbi:branched-chain amino acid transaminase [Prochlorothrix hollandica]|uniref:Branched-chain-amino-acid aminotransferase n=1 Tax=Prochlorothrix hollandica PCC 9006 = CALU 1027 TaxID=317619 RepID=A0A0M2PYQ7_PROHO|nr:branched-chain amino acid transaminase [Prochlorothrix hollandica]KKJ01300.1 branched-chain amino acid aminotransferase [Prochlorothrix hollandica PCC 9006 = CALU 1027]